MTLWRKIKRWELAFEKSPKERQSRLFVLLFITSFIFGVGISLHMKLAQEQKINSLTTEITRLEKARMDKRVENLKQIRYAQSFSL